MVGFTATMDWATSVPLSIDLNTLETLTASYLNIKEAGFVE